MKKQIKQYGNSLVIKITAEDQEIYDLEAGDIVDIELIKVDEPTRRRK
jgi:antitoxin component of MazEF toxin-antitoxin module